MIKNILIAFLVLLLPLLLLSEEKTKHPSAEEIYTSAINNIKSLKGYHIKLKVHLSLGGETGTYEVSSHTIFNSPDLSYANIEATGNSKLTSVFKGEKKLIYLKSENKWRKLEDTGIIIPAQELLNHFKIFEKFKEYIMKASKVNITGKKTTLSFTVEQNNQNIIPFLKDLNIDTEKIDWKNSEIYGDIHFKKINEKLLPTYIIINLHLKPIIDQSNDKTKKEAEATTENDAEVITGTISVTFYNFNKNIVIDLPKGIRKYLGLEKQEKKSKNEAGNR